MKPTVLATWIGIGSLFLTTSVNAEKTAVVRWDAPADLLGRTTSRPIARQKEKVIALTFDDGPTTQITPTILKTLKQEKVPATFFVLGQLVRAYPKLTKQIVAEGHAIGIHTYTHSPRPTAAQASREMDMTEKALQQALNQTTHLFRSPYGNLKSAYTKEAIKRKYANILWSNSSGDTATRKTQVVYANVTRYAKPGDIVLMHDSAYKKHTAAALPKIIATLKKQGYRFVTVPEMLTIWKTWARQAPPQALAKAARKKPSLKTAKATKATKTTRVAKGLKSAKTSRKPARTQKRVARQSATPEPTLR